MQFQATKEQVAQIMANAANASKPMGLGFMHYNSSQSYAVEDFIGAVNAVGLDRFLSIDYLDGRMVKLDIQCHDNDTYSIRDNPTADYQSWVSLYPTTQALVDSVLSAK